jgi:CBS domain-containing protein
MAERGFYHIPLVLNKQLTGILSVRTLIRFLAEFYPAEVYNLPPNPHQIMATPEGG